MNAPLPLVRTYDWLAIIGLATSIAFTIYFYDTLPERIPTHFDGSGQPDGWSGKAMLWSLPILGLVMYVVLGLAGRAASSGNYWSTLQPKPEETETVKALSRTLIAALRAIIILKFTYLSWGSIQIALKRSEGLWSGSLAVFLVILLGYVFYYSYEMYKRSK